MDKNITGNIFDIQHFSTHDGPGIRCTVFFKGCNLRCLWCHNPEGFFTRPLELSFIPSRCIGCGYCFNICPNRCHVMKGNTHILDWKTCIRCGLCSKNCYSKALTTTGRSVMAEEVINEVMRDAIFYETSGGGITLSGGEPMLQREFVKTILYMAKKSGLHTVMETCAVYDYTWLDGIKENVDLFLVDFKMANPEEHKRLTGADNKLVYENLEKLHGEGYHVLLRCPIIKGLNDTAEHLKEIADLTSKYPGFAGAELLPYHRLGFSKIKRFGLSDEIFSMEFETANKETEKRWMDEIRGYGGRLYGT